MLMKKAVLSAFAVAMLTLPIAAPAQQPSKVIVSLYHAAPGEQIALIKWLAEQDRVSAAAGIPAGQLYVHSDGAEWDYVLIQPAPTAAQDAAFDAAARKMGVATGPRAGLEFRKHILSHSDTFASGPTTAAAFLAAIGEK